MGTVLAAEAHEKGAQCVLGPTVCIHRHPLGGRNFESFSEDPFLAGKLAAQVIHGLQEHGVSATIKHFVANEQETARTTVDETISERALREIYLRPFEIAIREANPWAIMTAYNSVHGSHCDAHKWLLEDVLRDQWKWDGFVISDWSGTNSVADSREVTEDVIDDRVRSVLRFVTKLIALSKIHSQNVTVNQPEDRALIRKAGSQGIVLLKNENEILPLQKDKLKGKRIALVGLAKDALDHGGGSASVNAYYKITPWEGLKDALGDQVEVLYAKGFHKERLIPSIDSSTTTCGTVVGLDGKTGFTRLLFDFKKENGVTEKSDPVSTLHGFLQSSYSPLGSQESLWKTLEIVGNFTPSETGKHCIACSGLGPTQVLVEDEVIFEQKDNSSDPMGSLFLAAPEEEIRHEFVAGRTYRLCIRSHSPVGIGLDILEGRSGVRMGMQLESVHDEDLQGEAARIAAEADLAIVFTGHDPQWESEGRDKDSFHLPRRGTQDGVVSAVAAANPNTIVVNSTGVAIAMPWPESVCAVVQAWFPGQECGNSIAEVMTGVVNPEGRLPVSFPRRIQDAPAFDNFPGEYVDGQLKVTYAEDVFVGHRWYDAIVGDTLNFPFGHGLSYTTFSYGSMVVSDHSSEKEDTMIARLEVSNTGTVYGGTVIQIYGGIESPAAQHPLKSLVAFKKIHLTTGETMKVELSISLRDMAYFDEKLREWALDAGRYIFYLGNSASDILQTVSVTLERRQYKTDINRSTSR
ncbi:hypothetical protein N7493_011289 [Penicillium malachiteum]|uniref:beta-glucosidase n=1 Tax=Penicillium malachiteum TaxID=1324776 RepID=A0AAD6MR17_9EURO|nr:hypothetical protein N7493_011289 [Penicillium malachiteum]